MFDSLIYRLRKLFSTDSVKLLSIGMENSYAGPCPGAGKGAERLYNTIKPRCNYAKLLVDRDATKAKVVSEMQKVCNSDLAIITYCGHGGQQSGRTNETDGKDEFLALYDQKMLDNEIWNIVSKAKGRVFMIFDCCHSETMFCDNWRQTGDKVYIAGLPFGAVDLLCWSGCSDGQVSYSVPTAGGFFTSCIIRNADAGYTYDEAWRKIAGDKNLAQRETVKSTILKSDTKFKGKKLFS